MAEIDRDAADLGLAWELCYLDPARAGAAGRRLATGGGGAAAWGWWHVALAEVRAGSAAVAEEALAHARAGFGRDRDRDPDLRGLALADEVRAIALRRAGDLKGAFALQSELELRPGIELRPLDRFIVHNSRAATFKRLGCVDDALRHLHAAVEAADASGNAGARITAMCNLGALQYELCNLEDARSMCERAFHEAREVRAPQALAASAHTLILTYAALGEALLAREMTEYLLGRPEELPPGTHEMYRGALALGHLVVGEIDAARALIEASGRGAGSGGEDAVFRAWLSARCALAMGETARARAIAQRTLVERAAGGHADSPYDLMELHRVLADACEAMGDTPAALACVRRSHQLYEQLVGRSARARRVALQVGFELERAQRERDVALDMQQALEAERRRLAEVNAELQRQIAANESLQAQLREQALRDPLTGLHNRRYLFEVGPGLLDGARRRGNTLAVVLLDLDHFKLLNDTYGHQAGDQVLQRFGMGLAQTLRRSDVVCRHGGEEFVALMPDIDGDGAEAMLARLLEQRDEPPSEPGRRRLPRCTFSAGIAMFPAHGTTLEQLLSRADRALYRAKQQGRARIEQVPDLAFGTLA